MSRKSGRGHISPVVKNPIIIQKPDEQIHATILQLYLYEL